MEIILHIISSKWCSEVMMMCPSTKTALMSSSCKIINLGSLNPARSGRTLRCRWGILVVWGLKVWEAINSSANMKTPQCLRPLRLPPRTAYILMSSGLPMQETSNTTIKWCPWSRPHSRERKWLLKCPWCLLMIWIIIRISPSFLGLTLRLITSRALCSNREPYLLFSRIIDRFSCFPNPKCKSHSQCKRS